MVNPYKQLLAKTKALLACEARLEPEERRQNQWQLLIKFSGVQVVVGKGDVNTMFILMGEEPRRVCYPDALLERLQALGDQPYWRYEMVTPDKGSQFYWTLARLKRDTVPMRGAVVYGHRETRERVLHASKGLDGYEWKK